MSKFFNKISITLNKASVRYWQMTQWLDIFDIGKPDLEFETNFKEENKGRIDWVRAPLPPNHTTPRREISLPSEVNPSHIKQRRQRYLQKSKAGVKPVDKEQRIIAESEVENHHQGTKTSRRTPRREDRGSSMNAAANGRSSILDSQSAAFPGGFVPLWLTSLLGTMPF